jgi:hypothetical protein
MSRDGALVNWRLPLSSMFGIVSIRALRGRAAFDGWLFLSRAWPALIPVVWFEVLSSHIDPDQPRAIPSHNPVAKTNMPAARGTAAYYRRELIRLAKLGFMSGAFRGPTLQLLLIVKSETLSSGTSLSTARETADPT